MDRISEWKNKMKGVATVCTACCVFALTACSDNEADGGRRLPHGEYPMAFTAAVDRPAVTRAGTADGAWTDTDRIAVQASDATSGNEIKIYAPSAISGNSATLTSDEPFYWQRSDETKTVCAWYCGDGSTASGGTNAGAVPARWSVPADQSGEENYRKGDFLYTPATNISFGDTDRSLTFTHQTARVVINIKHAEAATDAVSISRVVIGYDNNLSLSGAYTAPVGDATTGTWNIAGGTMGTVIPKDITATSGGGDVLKTYAALVIPQDMSGRKFIAVTLTDNNTYYYTPQDTDADLKSGTQYTYDITVKNGYLEVVTVKDGKWDNGTTETVTSVQTFTEDDLKIGDYYYSDGKTSDGGLRKINADGSIDMVANIQPVLSGSDGSMRTCIGIVYWVGDITGDNYGLLDGKFPNGTQGLVVSLWDMPDPDNQGVTMTWTYGDCNNEYVNDWLDNATWTGGTSRPASFTSIQVTDKMQGYANTLALKEYNKYIENPNSGKDQNLRVKPVKGLDAFETAHSSPSNSSGWYWPSVSELKYVCWGQGATGQSTAGKEMLNTQIGKVSGSNVSGSSYWSSTEYSDFSYNAWYVFFRNGSVMDFGSKHRDDFRVRPLLAF